MVEFKETALSIENLQNTKDVPLHEMEDKNIFRTERNYRRRGRLYKVKKFIRVWANRYYFSLVPESQDPRWTPRNDTVTFCKPPPVAMIVMATLATISYLIDGYRGLLVNTNNPKSIAALLVYDPYHRSQLWRYITPLLVHTESFHLGTNLMLQIRFGIPLEVANGWWRVLLVYLAGVLAGTLGSSLACPLARLAGASAGVFSIIIFAFISIIVKWKELEAPAVKLIFNVTIIISSVVSSLYSRLTTDISNISDSAHFAGAVTGLFLGIFILRTYQPTQKKIIIGWLCFVAYFLSIGTAIGFHLFYPKYFPE